MSFFKSEKCSICKKHKGHRFCFRKGKDICWQDCNLMRVDGKCPQECEYTIQKTDALQLKTKADSIMEYQDLLKKQMDRWILLPQEVFGGEMPKNMSESESGRKRLTEFLNQFQINPVIPLNYLKEKLSLVNLKVISQEKNYEDIAVEFLNLIILQEWEKTIDFLKHKVVYQDNEFKSNYINRLDSLKYLKKATDFFLISSALSEDKKKALVYFDLNGKYDLTLLLERLDNSWIVLQKIFGKPELANSESQANQQIAIMLSKNKLSDAFELLKKYSSIYVDSADINYYWGMYYMFSNNTRRAASYLLNSIELDPDFLEAKALYATAILQEKQTEKAKKLFEEIIAANPKEIKSMNNLASIYIEEGNNEKARELLQQCLKIDPNFVYAKKNLEKLN
ncbi:MAG: tetratricopeptide repeat protein [Candidatus Cloacimonetes bacterium]|nr:tetratricopeptide repeat protein [Candidatus Cloacimonadota bacterium]MCF7814095.1 tetratricopeptide repeat protein [Candidatus Cloacimonadota bacterium]MCF7867976.1 tetratricopeptide repeat protein [Candidatus Cloacimonadota bacterium]MCF7883434.1 tetratricopeptide repeat protein [Candidatus Cloacimonadota bacterium]